MAAFFAFMNRELREVYPNMPLLVKEEGKFTLEERRTLEMCVRIMLPDPLPAGAAQTGDIIDYLEEYVIANPTEELQGYRDILHAAGLVLPVLGGDITSMREFVEQELRSKARSPVRDVLSLMHTLVTLPYYAHPNTDDFIKYKRPEHEPHATPTKLPVAAEPPNDLYDVVIAGSGPAGSLLAARFAAAGKKVVVLEAGPHVPEVEIAPDELLSLAKVYKGGGLQRANEMTSIFDVPGPTFFVLQGGCIGGGAIVNNTVCFQLSPERYRQWQGVGFPITESTLRNAYLKVAQELPILPVSHTAKHINGAGTYLADAFGPPKQPPVDAPPAPGFYECLVNLEPLDQHGNGCLGKGVCNVGCGSERKRNAYQVHLKSAVANGCVIVPNARVRDVIFDPAARTVKALGVQLRTGYKQVRGKEFILSAGPIGSTEILLRSASLRQLLETAKVPIGQRFSANLGSPVWAFTTDDAQKPPGLQIAHYYYPAGDNPPFVFETWYNPPGANAVAMPGYMKEHFDRMTRYMSTIAAAPLVGSRPRGKISLRQDKVRVKLPVGAEEVEGFAHGLSLLASAFVKSPRVENALVGFGAGRVIETEADAIRLRDQLLKLKKQPKHLHLLKMGTGHPQGGNAMSTQSIGVVGADFRVRGVENLRICDGSIFPDSACVNPQWTIMALAEICAADMLGT